MTSAAAQTRYTPEQYLALERAAETKSEYINGLIVAMSGASRAHGLITGNVYAGIHGQIRGQACEAFASDMRVKVSETGMYMYPDVVVACGEIRFEDVEVDTLLNPTLIVEVLSPSTEAYDRGAKFAHYRRLPSLQEYVLMAQDKVLVERYVRQGDHWLFSEAGDLDTTVSLTSIGCELSLRAVYDKVPFPSSDDAPPAPVPEQPR